MREKGLEWSECGTGFNQNRHERNILVRAVLTSRKPVDKSQTVRPI